MNVMSLIRPSRAMNQAAADAFDEKYGEALNDAVWEILEKYKISSQSKLAVIISLSLKKFLLGLVQKQSAFEQWCISQQLPNSPESTKKNYPMHMALTVTNHNITRITPEFDLLLKIDLGRNKASFHAENLLEQYASEISVANSENAAFEVLGSIIRRAINIYCPDSQNNKHLTFSSDQEDYMRDIGRIRERLSPK